MARFPHWPAACLTFGMFYRLGRLFVIKTKFEAFLVIYGLAPARGARRALSGDLSRLGRLDAVRACPIAVFMAGAKILDSFDVPE
jgi:hypothetical protein